MLSQRKSPWTIEVSSPSGMFAGQPFDQPVHIGIAPGIGVFKILPRPAADLAGEIIAGLAIVAQADGGIVDGVEPGDGLVHRIETGGAFRVGQAGESRIPENAALDHVHDIEPAADDAVVGAQAIDMRDREVGAAQRGENARLAVDRMGARQHLAGRLAAQHIGLARGDQLVGRVGLPALELFDAHRPGKARDIGLQPAGKRGFVKCKTFADRAGAGIGVLIGGAHCRVAWPSSRA